MYSNRQLVTLVMVGGHCGQLTCRLLCGGVKVAVLAAVAPVGRPLWQLNQLEPVEVVLTKYDI